ncbi:MAG: hypothetical protein ACI8XO_004680 [Verrucomicrobiales bacterium]|jgi:hypothetical protein
MIATWNIVIIVHLIARETGGEKNTNKQKKLLNAKHRITGN